MAAPVAAFIQLPSDTGNTGKKVRTQTRVVGADTVHEHFFVPLNPRSILGMYYISSGILSSATTGQNGTTTGNFWLANPVGATTRVIIHSIKYSAVTSTMATADLVAARIAFNLFTFTGTASGATIAYAKRDSTDAAAGSSVRTANTGMTVTLGNAVRADLLPNITGTTGVGQSTPYISPERDFTWDEMTVLRAGEGMVCYFPESSTTANKKVTVDLIIEEAE